MRKAFLTIMLLVACMAARAFDFSQVAPSGQTLYFNITSDSTVSVVSPGWGEYAPPTGVLELPATVQDDGVTYKLTAIAINAFRDCIGLTGVVIPEGVESIGTFAFAWCNSLSSIVLPSTITEIRSQAFYETAYLANNSNWNGAVIYIGNYLIASREIGDSAIVVREDTKGIAAMAFFYNQRLRSIVLPESLLFIGERAFSECGNIDTVRINALVPPTIKDNTFEMASPFLLRVPCGHIDDYTNATYWSSFQTEEMCEPGDPESPYAMLHVWTYDGGLMIKCHSGENIRVYNPMGFKLMEFTTTATKTKIPLQHLGVYIICSDSGLSAIASYFR